MSYPEHWLKVEIEPKDKPFEQIEVDPEIAKMIRKISKEHPQWGPERIAAHARLVREQPSVTYDHVCSVLTPKK